MMGKWHIRISVSLVAAAMTMAAMPMGVAAAEARDSGLAIAWEDLVVEEDSLWQPEERAMPLKLKALARPDLTADPVSLRVNDVEALGFIANVKGGSLQVLVDGEPVGSVKGYVTKDIPLTPGEHLVTWQFLPTSPYGEIELILAGAVALLAPTTDTAPQILWRWCGGAPMFYIHFVFSLLVAQQDVAVTFEGEEIGITHHSWISGFERHHYVYGYAPSLPHGTPAEIEAIYTDVKGKIWKVADLLTTTRVVNPVVLTPAGWVYDLQPTVTAYTPCGHEPATTMRLYVDGVDVTEGEGKGAYAVYRFPERIPFGETHTAKAVATFADGSTEVVETTFREGLDVLEFDVSRLALVFGESYVETPTTGFGTGVFANALAPNELPPIQDWLRGPLHHDPSQPWLWPEGAHLEAVFAPLGIECRITYGTCSPYAGEAPGFGYHQVSAAELIVTAPDGSVTTIPGAGQWAVASRYTLDPDQRLPRYAKETKDFAEGFAGIE